MDNDQFVPVANFLKGKRETDSYMLDVFHCRLTATIQLSLHHRFLTAKIQG